MLGSQQELAALRVMGGPYRVRKGWLAVRWSWPAPWGHTRGCAASQRQMDGDMRKSGFSTRTVFAAGDARWRAVGARSRTRVQHGGNGVSA